MELIERIAGKLETWAKSWGKRLLKDRPNGLDFRQFLSAEFESAHIPQVAFVLEFCSGLNEALEGFDYIREELQHYMPSMAEPVHKKHDDLIIDAESIGQVTADNVTWLKKFNGSRNRAISLAKTLHHILEMAREDKLSENPGETEESADSDDMPQIYVELNLAERLLVIGADKCRISSEAVWDFLKTLAGNTKRDQITPRIDGDRNWKNAVDVLRRKIGADALRQVVTYANGGYYLGSSVKTTYGSQVGIRRTRLEKKTQHRIAERRASDA